MATKKVTTEEAREIVETPATETPKETKETKKAKKAKEEAKVEAPKKPMPTSARATSNNVRVTPRKARLVIDLVRGKSVKTALGILKNTNKAASTPVYKTVASAAANAVNNFGMDEGSLYISEIYATDGIKMRRYLPRAKGSSSGLVKRSCNITVVVKMK